MSGYKPGPSAYHPSYGSGGPPSASASTSASARGPFPPPSSSHPTSPPSRSASRAHSPFQLDTTSGLLSPAHTGGGGSGHEHGGGSGHGNSYGEERPGQRGRRVMDGYDDAPEQERWRAHGGQGQAQSGYSSQPQHGQYSQHQSQGHAHGGFRSGYDEPGYPSYASHGAYPDGGPSYQPSIQTHNLQDPHQPPQHQPLNLHPSRHHASQQQPFAPQSQLPMTASSSSSSMGGFFSPNGPSAGAQRGLMGPPSSGGHGGPFGTGGEGGDDARGNAYGMDDARGTVSGGAAFGSAAQHGANAMGLAGLSASQSSSSASAYGYDSAIEGHVAAGATSQGRTPSGGYSFAGSGAPRGALGMRGIPPRGPANSLSSLGLTATAGGPGYTSNGAGPIGSGPGQLWNPQADDARSNASDRGSRGPRQDERGSRHGGRRDGRDARDARDGRERERDRDRDRDREREKERDEEISTIFVVGFPDDMTEREFQNMFTFASGFEAAMLKVPQLAAAAGQERKDRETALAVSLSLENLSAIPVALQQQVASRHSNSVTMLAELQSLQEHFVRSSTANSDESSNPPAEEIAAALTTQLQQVPSASSDGHSRGTSRDPPAPTRRQIIGFARFRTRADALVARDILQGRKIDIFPGSVLKAEMAKKNLHTKRPVPGEDVVSMLVRSGRLSGLLAGMNLGAAGMALTSSNASITGMTSGTSTPSGQALSTAVMPSSSPAPTQTRNRAFVPSGIDAATGSQRGHSRGQTSADRPADNGGATARSSGDQSARQNEYVSQLQDTREEDGDRTILQEDSLRRLSISSRPPAMQHRRSDDMPWSPLPPPSEHEARRFEQMLPSRQTDSGYGSAYAATNSAASPEMSTMSPPDKPKDSKALLALAEEADELEGWRVGHMGMDQLDHFDGESRAGTPNYQNAVATEHSVPGPYYRAQRGSVSDGYGVSPQDDPNVVGDGPNAGLSRLSFGVGAAMLPHIKPADQNPPINTLYVGNLPATPSTTHPPNMLEDALRHLFGQCSGFKRLSYRQKLTPQCFVEFVDVASATRAMRELYGHTLNGLVRGGIRIAYSRNPLGQRGGGQFSPPSRNVNMPAPFGAAMGGIAPYQQISLSPTGGTGQLPFALQYQGGNAPSTYRHQSESTPLSPQAPPFSLPTSRSTSLATSPRFSARDHALATSPSLPTTTPWASGPTSGPSFSAFDAPHLRSG